MRKKMLTNKEKGEKRTCSRRVSVPTEEQYTDVVIPVQEKEGLLTKNNEDSVDEFRDFGEDEEHHPETCGAGAPRRQRGSTYCCLVGRGEDSCH